MWRLNGGFYLILGVLSGIFCVWVQISACVCISASYENRSLCIGVTACVCLMGRSCLMMCM